MRQAVTAEDLVAEGVAHGVAVKCDVCVCDSAYVLGSPGPLPLGQS